LVAGWASASHPGIAAVTRYFAIAATAGGGMRFGDPDVLLSLVIGGAMAFVALLLVWKSFRVPRDHNLMDLRAGVRRGFSGTDSGIRFALCCGAAAAVALFAATSLGVKEPFWATLTVLMVMRREGIASLELTIHYAIGTIVGVIAGAAILRWVAQPLALA